MVKRNIVLLDIDYITHDEKPVVRLFGKVKGEKSNDLIALDDSFIPYLYILFVLVVPSLIWNSRMLTPCCGASIWTPLRL